MHKPPLSQSVQTVTEWITTAEHDGFGRPSYPAAVAQNPVDGTAVVEAYCFASLDRAPARRVYALEGMGISATPRALGPAGHTAAWSPRWSPDGARLALIATTAEDTTPQLFVSTPGGLEDWLPATGVDGIVESLSWSPSGSRLLLVVAPHGADTAGIAGGTSYGDANRGSAWLPSIEPEAVPAPRSCYVVDTATLIATQLATPAFTVWEACWAGENSVAAITSAEFGEGDWYDNALSLISITDGGARQLYSSDGRQLALPTATDAHIALVEAVASDRGVIAGDVLLFEHSGGAPIRLDLGDTDAVELEWAGADVLTIVGARSFESVLGDYRPSTRRYQERWSGPETLSGVSTVTSTVTNTASNSRSDNTAAVRSRGILEAYDRYPQLVEIASSGPRTVWDFAHAGSASVARQSGTASVVSWAAPDGLRIDGMLITPAGTGPHPLVVHIHGGPVGRWVNRWGMRLVGTRYSFVNLLAARGYAVLHPNPRGSSGRGADFAARVRGDLCGVDTQDFLSGIDHLVAEGIADPHRIGLTGNSYGGMMASWLITQDQRFAAAVPTSPVTDNVLQHLTSNISRFDELFLGADPLAEGSLHRERSALNHVVHARTPTLLVAGGLDRSTPASQALVFHRALRKQGVETELVIYPRQGHGVQGFPESTDFIARLLDWFTRHMPADEARG